jgi:hypothetical protein
VTGQERPLDEQVSWLRAAQRAREASIRRHLAGADETADWAAVAAGTASAAPGWITEEAKREFLGGL